MLLSVIIPVYNEQDRLEAQVERSLASLKNLGLPYEVIIVDDGSCDGTTELAQKLSSFHAAVRTLSRASNTGKGAAIKSGLDVIRGDLVIIQDADLEYDPRDYRRLLSPLLSGTADVVFGSRFLNRNRRKVGLFWRYLANRLLTVLSNMMTNLNLTDMETGFKAFRREVVANTRLKENGFGFEPEFTARVAHGGWTVFEVSVSYFERTYKEGKKIRWTDGVWGLWCILKYNTMSALHTMITEHRRPGQSATCAEAIGRVSSLNRFS
jgi:glycosyltransferase involved in cell wall biosynthesis